MTWNCRLIKYDNLEPDDDGEYCHAVHEVFYDKEGKITLYTLDAMDVSGMSVEGAKSYYELLAEAFKAPVLLMSEMPTCDET